MNDDQNVIISNALGVVVLELGEKWEGQLASQHREMVLDLLLELAVVDNDLVFFKGRFIPILKSLGEMLEKFGSSSLHQRTELKIYRLLSLLRRENYQLHYSKTELKEILERKHKKLRVQYLTQATEEAQRLYDSSDAIL